MNTSHETTGAVRARTRAHARELRYDARVGRMLRLEEAQTSGRGWRTAWVDATDGFWPMAELDAIEPVGISASARVTRAGLALLRQVHEAERAAHPGQTPLVALGETVPVLVTQAGQTTLVRQPVFEIVGWTAEPPR